MSRPANVATGKCRDRQMSRPANVATGKCRDRQNFSRQMSRSANVATGKCRDRQMSRPANVAIGKSPTGKSPTGEVSVGRCRTITSHTTSDPRAVTATGYAFALVTFSGWTFAGGIFSTD